MRKTFWTLGLLLVLVTLFGCIQMDMKFKVNSDGKGSSEMTMDLSGLAAIGQSMGGQTDSNTTSSMQEEYKKENICATLQKNSDTSAQTPTNSPLGGLKASDARCEGLADYKAKFTWDNVDFVQMGLLTTSDNLLAKQYTLKFADFNAGTSASAVNAQQLKALGVKMTVAVEMPGSITSSTAGKIQGNTVSIDLIDEFDPINQAKGFTIVSEEMNLMIVGAGVVIIIIALLVIVSTLMRKKPGSPKPPQYAAPAAPTPTPTYSYSTSNPQAPPVQPRY